MWIPLQIVTRPQSWPDSVTISSTPTNASFVPCFGILAIPSQRSTRPYWFLILSIIHLLSATDPFMSTRIRIRTGSHSRSTTSRRRRPAYIEDADSDDNVISPWRPRSALSVGERRSEHFSGGGDPHSSDDEDEAWSDEEEEDLVDPTDRSSSGYRPTRRPRSALGDDESRPEVKPS